MTWILKQGDTAPKGQFDLNADITGATSVLMKVARNVTGVFVMSRTLAVVDAATGLCEYQPVSGDLTLLTPGAYRVDVVVVFADARIQRFSGRWFNELIVKEAVPAS